MIKKIQRNKGKTYVAIAQLTATLEVIFIHGVTMKAVAPGTVIFHRYRGYGVITSVNLMTGWISARFGGEGRTLDLNLS